MVLHPLRRSWVGRRSDSEAMRLGLEGPRLMKFLKPSYVTLELRTSIPKRKFGCGHVRSFAAALCVLALMTGGAANAETTERAMAQFKGLSLEELMNQEVTIVTKRAEPLAESPSAVQIITSDDIRRSGASSIPEALRLASNLQVAQVDSHQWAISARGFNNTSANKLLVMIDGRTVYTPLFAGVFWDVQDTFLPDIERIEVVSGPGATLWGANAVNGVINIVTKSARETQGVVAEAGGGSLLRDFVGARYGGQIGENLFFRLYGKYFDRENTVMPSGRDATNDWYMGQGGFRLDWLPTNGNALTVQGDAYGGSFEQPAPGSTSVDGQNLLARWVRTFSEESDLMVQAYFDRTRRRSPNVFVENLNTYDLDFQHRFPLGSHQSLMWGLGYRLMQDDVGNSAALAFLPEERNLQLFSGFLQDEITLVEDKLFLTLGSKVEHNDYSDFEVQPSVRLAWRVDDRQTLWAAVSRAVRSPSRIDRDLYFPGVAPYTIAGGSGFDSEKLIAYELGYRVRAAERLSLSLAGFFNDYDDIRSLEPFGGTNTFIIANQNRAEAWGVELSGNYEVVDWWRLRGGYTYLHKTVSVKGGGQDLNRGRAEGNDPHHQFVLQSAMDLPGNLEFNCVARYTDTLPDPHVPSYFTLDAQLAWRPIPNIELAVVGQNLWDEQHPEFGASASRQEIPRSIYGKLTWRF